MSYLKYIHFFYITSNLYPNSTTISHWVRVARKAKLFIYHVIVEPTGKQLSVKVNSMEKDERNMKRLKSENSETIIDNDNITSDYQKIMKDILKEYRDVFANMLPKGLPPDRAVEMRFDLEPNTNHKKGPIFQWEIGVLFGYKLDVIKKKWIYFRYAMDTVQT